MLTSVTCASPVAPLLRFNRVSRLNYSFLRQRWGGGLGRGLFFQGSEAPVKGGNSLRVWYACCSASYLGRAVISAFRRAARRQ